MGNTRKVSLEGWLNFFEYIAISTNFSLVLCAAVGGPIIMFRGPGLVIWKSERHSNGRRLDWTNSIKYDWYTGIRSTVAVETSIQWQSWLAFLAVTAETMADEMWVKAGSILVGQQEGRLRSSKGWKRPSWNYWLPSPLGFLLKWNGRR